MIDINKTHSSCRELPKARPSQRKVHYVPTTKRSGFGVYIGAQIDFVTQHDKNPATNLQ